MTKKFFEVKIIIFVIVAELNVWGFQTIYKAVWNRTTN
jgi:hypothetical protein